MSREKSDSNQNLTLKPKVTERDFTAQIIALARWYKWRVAHFRAAMTKRGRYITPVQGDGTGFPDLFMLRHNRRIMAELKSAKGKPTTEQTKWLESARSADIETYIWRPADIEEIERILK